MKNNSSGGPQSGHPLVTVCVITYNHEKYIDACLDGILVQDVDFPFEVLVHDDASTDRTPDIVRKYAERYPDLIVPVFQKENQFSKGVKIGPMLISKARSTYVALCEGDDYWTDPNKLRLQVAQLEGDQSLTFSACRTENRDFCSDVKSRYDLRDLLRRYIFHTSSLVLRRKCMEGFVPNKDVLATDSMIIAYLAQQGDCGFVDREMSYYRRHDQGVWNGKTRKAQVAEVQVLTGALSRMLNGNYDAELGDRELWIYGMMTTVNLAAPLLPQWTFGLSLLPTLFCRTLPHHFSGTIRLIVRVLLFPVVALWLRLRRRLGLRTRWATWMAGRRGTDAG